MSDIEHSSEIVLYRILFYIGYCSKSDIVLYRPLPLSANIVNSRILLIYRSKGSYSWVGLITSDLFCRVQFKLCLITVSPYPAAQRRNIKILMLIRLCCYLIKGSRSFFLFYFLFVNGSWLYFIIKFGQFALQQNGFHSYLVWLWIGFSSARTCLRKSDLLSLSWLWRLIVNHPVVLSKFRS